MSAILRGFNFLAEDVAEQLRFCNPLISFEECDTAPIYFARDLDWERGDEEQRHSLVLVEKDEIDSFATLFPRPTSRVSGGEGVVLMGERFSKAAQIAGINVDANDAVDLTDSADKRYRFGVADAIVYRSFVKQIIQEAVSVFDGELRAAAEDKLPKRAEEALFVLRKCGLTRPTDLAIRQLTAARVTGQADVYRRLLIRYSLELQDTEDNLDKQVERHIAVLHRHKSRRLRLRAVARLRSVSLNTIVLEHGKAMHVYVSDPRKREPTHDNRDSERTESNYSLTDRAEPSIVEIILKRLDRDVEKFHRNVGSRENSGLQKASGSNNSPIWAETSLRHH